MSFNRKSNLLSCFAVGWAKMAAQDNEEPMEVEDDDQVKPPENGVRKLLVLQSVEN